MGDPLTMPSAALGLGMGPMTDEEALAVVEDPSRWDVRVLTMAQNHMATCPSCERPERAVHFDTARGVCQACALYWSVADAHDLDLGHPGDFSSCPLCIPALRRACSM